MDNFPDAGPMATNVHVDFYRALDMPIRRILRFSPRRYIRNCNPALPRLNAANAVRMQAVNWGMDWSN